MEDQEKQAKRRLEKKSGKTFFLFFVIIVLCLCGTIFYFYPDKITSTDTVISTQPAPEDAPELLPDESLSENIKPAIPQVPPLSTVAEIKPSETDVATESVTPASNENNTVIPGNVSENNTSPSTDNNPCEPYLDNIEVFFDSLDSRTYIQNFELNQKSRQYFPNLIQRLIDNPPIVTGETDDLYTVLQNTAHFFRIIGKKNILVLKGILDREKKTFEQTLADFYQLTHTPSCLTDRFALNISDEALYLYSGFFLNTMGGRLYLFRRDSMSRMVVNFYAILIMDQATRAGKNKYGIPINQSIDRLINEIESSKIELQMRDYYLDTLYDMKEKYQ